MNDYKNTTAMLPETASEDNEATLEDAVASMKRVRAILRDKRRTAATFKERLHIQRNLKDVEQWLRQAKRAA